MNIRFFVASVCITLLAACGNRSLTQTQTSLNTAETSSKAADQQDNGGFSYKTFRLGMSLKGFKEEAGKEKLAMQKVDSRWPQIEEFYCPAATLTVASAPWNPFITFVNSDGVFRLYKISGKLPDAQPQVLLALTEKYGEPEKSDDSISQAYRWHDHQAIDQNKTSTTMVSLESDKQTNSWTLTYLHAPLNDIAATVVREQVNTTAQKLRQDRLNDL